MPSEAGFSRRHLALLAAGAGTFAAATLNADSAEAAVDAPWFDVREPWGGGPGAVGDGRTDDTGALQRAIDAAASASNGGVVLLPPGAFMITDLVTFPPRRPIDLVGAGKQQSRIVCAEKDAGLRFGENHENGATAGSSGGFWIRGVSDANPNQAPATTAMTIEGGSASRRFFDIQISRAVTGVRVEAIQNSIFENLRIDDNEGTGIVVDYGAGNNTFLSCSVRNNLVNVELRNTWDGSGSPPSQFRGRPTRNKFITCIIEGSSGERTKTQVDHQAGLLNFFIACSFAGNGPKLKIRHQAAGEDWQSHRVHVVGCSLLGGSGIEHTANPTTVHIRDTHFQTLTPAFTLGNNCKVDIDSYIASGVQTRFANAPGGTAMEQQLIRYVSSQIGNASNASSVPNPGSVVKKIEVFDPDGRSLGYVPVYSSIT